MTSADYWSLVVTAFVGGCWCGFLAGVSVALLIGLRLIGALGRNSLTPVVHSKGES